MDVNAMFHVSLFHEWRQLVMLLGLEEFRASFRVRTRHRNHLSWHYDDFLPFLVP